MTRRHKEVREAASIMIERYGQSARQQVEQRVQELRASGEREAVQLWEAVRAEAGRRLDKRGNGRSH